MILIDTSAWVEFLRDTSSPECREVDRLLSSDIASCDVVSMELFAGARDDSHLRDLRGLLARTSLLDIQSVDYESAASLYRRCRAQGATVRRLVDCLIASVAIRHGVPLLHRDGDFAAISRHCQLVIHRPK